MRIPKWILNNIWGNTTSANSDTPTNTKDILRKTAQSMGMKLTEWGAIRNVESVWSWANEHPKDKILIIRTLLKDNDYHENGANFEDHVRRLCNHLEFAVINVIRDQLEKGGLAIGDIKNFRFIAQKLYNKEDREFLQDFIDEKSKKGIFDMMNISFNGAFLSRILQSFASLIGAESKGKQELSKPIHSTRKDAERQHETDQEKPHSLSANTGSISSTTDDKLLIRRRRLNENFDYEILQQED